MDVTKIQAPAPNCSKCQKFPREWPCSDFITFEHHESFRALDQSAATGCPLCRIFRQTLLFEDEATQLMQTSSPVVVQISGPFHISICIYTGTSLDTTPLGPYGLLEIKETTATTSRSLVSSLGIRRFHPTDQADELQDVVKSVIQPWMVGCCKDATTANRANNNPLPTRVIDVDGGTGYVRLVETNGQCGPYLILSYCWGKGNDLARTTKWNLDERKRSIQIGALPATIQQAVEVTKKLGLCHLWVDAICIIQADSTPPQHDDLEDWRREAPKMGQYYQNAVFTIAATAATDSGQGFVRERPSQTYSVSPCSIGSWVKDSNPMSDAMVIPGTPSATNQVHYGPLYTRSWTLQERVLSPHTVHWCRESVFWECHGCIKASESQPALPSPTEATLPGNGHAWATVLSQSREVPTYFNEFWLDLIEDYAQMHISYETDRLIAIQGLVSRLPPASQADDVYIAGIFKSGLINGLAWCNTAPKSEKVDKVPSWSWASLSAGNLSFDHLVGRFATLTSANNFDILGRDTLSDGRLELSCPMREIHTTLIQYDGKNRSAIIDETYPFKMRFNFDTVGNVLKYQGNIGLLPLGWELAQDATPASGTHGTTGKRDRLVIGLLLWPTGNYPREYKRIGLFRVREPAGTREWDDAPKAGVYIL